MTKRGLLERTLQLKEVNIVEQRKASETSANLNGSGRADFVVTSDMLDNCTTLEQCLIGRVAGLIIQNGEPYLMRNLSSGQPMSIILDGMNVGSDFLDNIIPSDVETIEVLKSVGNTAIYGSQGGGGVLIITTKRGGGYSSSSFAPGIMTYAPKGYPQIRQFYSPKYSPTEPDNRADLRNTVYWQPHLLTNTDGKGQFSFFNTDEAGTYRIVVEGIDMAGRLARAVYTYEVK
ncbi:TonB-dependent Receptor Plug Domain protein [compost metagenome]